MVEMSLNSSGIRDIVSPGWRCHGHERVKEKETISEIRQSKGLENLKSEQVEVEI